MLRRSKQLIWHSVLFLLLVGPVWAVSPCAIVMGPDAPNLEQKAGQELQRYFLLLFGFRPPLLSSDRPEIETLILVGSPTTNPWVKAVAGHLWSGISEQGFLLHNVRFAGKPALVVGGGSPLATLWAAYDLLEKYGVRYLLNGDFIPEKRQAFRLPELEAQREPNLRLRCWRVWNAHAFGPESWGIEEQRRVMDQLVKMKFNAILVYLWPYQPFVHYEFRGVKKSSGDVFFGWKYPLDQNVIGFEKFGAAQEFMNPDFLQARNYEERLAAGQALMHGILNYAHSQGLKTIVSFPLIDFPQEFKNEFKNWLPAEFQPTAEDHTEFTYEGLYTFGTDREGAPFLNVDNPALMELVETMVQAHINTYPEADYYAIGAAEFRSSVAGYQRIWKVLDQKYGVETTDPVVRLLEKARNRGLGWKPERAENEVKGDIEFLYFIDKLINERKVLQKTQRPDANLIVAELAPELHPVLPILLPKGSGYLANLDYTMSLSAKRADSLQTLGHLWSMLTITLSDDNISLLLQMPGRSAETLLKALRQYGSVGYMVRYWMLGDLEPSANFVARASWDKDLTVEQAYQELIATVCGKAAQEEAMRGFSMLEEVTSWMESQESLLGYGFPVPTNLLRHFEAQAPAPTVVAEVIRRYEAALPPMYRARELATGQGRSFLNYFVGRLEATVGYLRLTQNIRAVGVAYKEWKELKLQNQVAPTIEKRDQVLRLASQAESQARSAVQAFANVARDQSDKGMLAIMNRYLYDYVRGLHASLELELAFWHIN